MNVQVKLLTAGDCTVCMQRYVRWQSGRCVRVCSLHKRWKTDDKKSGSYNIIITGEPFTTVLVKLLHKSVCGSVDHYSEASTLFWDVGDGKLILYT